jgi:uncharacterized membrane protein YcaP (DUF421 family)
MAFDPVDWHSVFAVDTPVLEIVVRGTIMYLAVFAILRLSGRRLLGELAMLDNIFVVLLAIAAFPAMVGDQRSIGSGIILLFTIVLWNYILNWITFHFPRLERLVASPPLLVVENGKLIRRNMRREFLTVEELMFNLRERGYHDIASIRRAVVEPDGNISVVADEGAIGAAPGPPPDAHPV